MPQFNLPYGGKDPYIIKLSRDLKRILNNLDGGNFSPTYLKTIDKVKSLSEQAAKAAEDVKNGVEIKYKELNNQIIASAEEINQKFESEIIKNNDELLTTVREELTVKASIAEMNALLESYVSQTSKDINISFNQSYLYTTEVEGRLKEFQQLINTYFKFSADGMELGKSDSPFKTLLTNEKLSFTQNGTEIAYVSNRKLYITDVEILGAFKIKNWKLHQKSNANLCLSWEENNEPFEYN